MDESKKENEKKNTKYEIGNNTFLIHNICVCVCVCVCYNWVWEIRATEELKNWNNV
jgi:hypothetical protein